MRNRLRCVLAVVAPMLLMITGVMGHHLPDAGKLADREPDQSYNEQEEAFIRTPRGFDSPGKLRQASGDQTATLRVEVVDTAAGRPIACRVNVVGLDGNYYQPQAAPLEAFAAQHAGCHLHGETHAPSRYYGWYFYTTGPFEVEVPAGDVRIEAFKGYEFRPVTKTVRVAANEQRSVQLKLERTLPLHEAGYYSGDTHLHLNRRNHQDDAHALDLVAAEDIRYGFVLCMNPTDSYSGHMDRQEWPQRQGLGRDSVKRRGDYGIVSAQEYRAQRYGHICLLMHDRLVLAGISTDPNNWPVFGVVGEMTRQRGGYSFHAHGGYSLEIYADYLQQATDGVELLQMAHYRGIGLRGWYRIMNIGYRFPAIAGSDFPYTRALGDCRTYVWADTPPTFSQWAKRAAAGHAFVTTGPLLLLEVNGQRPGETIDLAELDGQQDSASHTLRAKLQVRCEVTHVEYLDLIVNGQTLHRWSLPTGDANLGTWHTREVQLPIDQPSWIAARAHGRSPTGRSDAEAHTNPVYVTIAGREPFHRADAAWLLEKLDGQIEALQQRSFPEQSQALDYFQKSRQQLIRKLQ